jgi:uncharacterized protein (TIGR00369 family)
MTDDVSAAAVPDGFERHFRTSPLTDPWEPIYSRKTETALVLGLHLRKEHCNSRGFAHGGLISALADNAMGLSCGLALGGARLVTVNLTVDYLGTAQVGAWLEIEPTFVRSGKTICFAQAFVTADAASIARANAVFRVMAHPTEAKVVAEEEAHSRVLNAGIPI